MLCYHSEVTSWNKLIELKTILVILVILPIVKLIMTVEVLMTLDRYYESMTHIVHKPLPPIPESSEGKVLLCNT